MPQRELLREVNERIAELLHTQPPAAVLGLLCECGRAGCTVRIALSEEEFGELRAVQGRYAVTPEHVREGVDDVVLRGATFVVVEP